MQISDVLDIHEKICGNHHEERNIQLSIDGVQECRSNSISLDVYSMKMKNCRTVYPLKIIRPIHKFHIDYKPHLKAILDSFTDTNCVLNEFVADNKKRATVKEVLNHASLFGCEYCTSKACPYREKKSKLLEEKKSNEMNIKKIEGQINSLLNTPVSTSSIPKQEEQINFLRDLIEDLKKKNCNLFQKHTHPVWPESTSKGELRTREETLSIIEAIEEGNTQLSADDVKGIVGRSLLLDVPSFDFVHDVVVDYMHAGCIGVVKRLAYKCIRFLLHLKKCYLHMYGITHILHTDRIPDESKETTLKRPGIYIISFDNYLVSFFSSFSSII